MTRKKLAIIVLGLILLVSLLACGYFGFKTFRRSHQRRVAMATYEKKDYVLAERLLLAYVSQDQNSEPEFVALANIYHEFGNYGMEAQMWQRAAALNPLNGEYQRNMLDAAVKSASYYLLYSALGRRVQQGETLDDRDLLLYLFSCYRTGHLKDAESVGKQYHLDSDSEPELFRKSDLGRLVGQLAKEQQDKTPDAESLDRLKELAQSDDPLVRYEALYFILLQMSDAEDEGTPADDEEIESFIRRLVDANYYAGTPVLADFFYSRSRFADVMAVSEPYLKKIDDLNMYLLYLESCVFENQLEPLREMTGKLHGRPGSMPFLGDYGEILASYLEQDSVKLRENVRKYGKLITSPLSRYIRLQTVIDSGASFSEVRTAANDFFSVKPSQTLLEKAVPACLKYMEEQMARSGNQDVSQMAELAQIVAGCAEKNEFLSTIILIDQYKRGLAKEADLLAALKDFPGSLILRRVAAEYLILNNKAERAMPLIEDVLKASGDKTDRGIQFLHLLALEQLKQYDEAGKVFLSLVEQSLFDTNLLYQYFDFCTRYHDVPALNSMADKLETVQDGKLEHYAKFFRAAAIYEQGRDAASDTVDGDALKTSLTILKDAPTGDANFTFYAANQLSRHDWLDDAETKYKAILKTNRDPSLIFVNLSELYQAKGEQAKALEAAKEAYSIEKQSMLPAFVYAKRLSEAERYEEAVAVLNFPRRAVNYCEDVVELWAECMKKTIEKNIADHKYTQAEENCKHLLVIVPEDAFGQEKLDEVRKLMHPDDQKKDEAAEPAAS
ncbi:MAG: hypothetical protein PUC15_00460 [Lentisphaeria bacterium]|nr:hypothetical protein [Lentisphaeria bacterium]